jgi:hypothetical protein
MLIHNLKTNKITLGLSVIIMHIGTANGKPSKHFIKELKKFRLKPGLNELNNISLYIDTSKN